MVSWKESINSHCPKESCGLTDGMSGNQVMGWQTGGQHLCLRAADHERLEVRETFTAKPSWKPAKVGFRQPLEPQVLPKPREERPHVPQPQTSKDANKLSYDRLISDLMAAESNKDPESSTRTHRAVALSLKPAPLYTQNPPGGKILQGRIVKNWACTWRELF